jgi:hypothetical protein
MTDDIEFEQILNTNRDRDRFYDPKWRIDNLEYDLLITDWILDKVRSNENYAQNLYAALCNNDFTKNDVWPILSEKRWHCSWRYAGGIIARMQKKGDYMDWYCSGIFDEGHYISGSVSEGEITKEISDDLFKLGWLIVTGDKNE